MIDVKLPWPPAALSPNSRLHWSATAKIKQRYRHTCKLVTLQQAPKGLQLPAALHMQLYFTRSSRRGYDRDNLVARMKAGIDGVCDALKINDRCIEVVTARVATEIDKDNPHVRLVLLKAEDNL